MKGKTSNNKVNVRTEEAFLLILHHVGTLQSFDKAHYRFI